MNKYYEDIETGIDAPTLDALKEKLVNYHWEIETQQVFITKGINCVRELIIKKNKTKFLKISKILEKLEKIKNCEAIFNFQNDVIDVYICYPICRDVVIKFEAQVNKELDEAYKNEKESFDPARDYDFGM